MCNSSRSTIDCTSGYCYATHDGARRQLDTPAQQGQAEPIHTGQEHRLHSAQETADGSTQCLPHSQRHTGPGGVPRSTQGVLCESADVRTKQCSVLEWVQSVVPTWDGVEIKGLPPSTSDAGHVWCREWCDFGCSH